MILIDWISAEDHTSFNESLFSALDLKPTHLYIFSEKLKGPKCPKTVISCEGRYRRTLKVLKLCAKHRNEDIFFLTYDPVLLPLVQLFCNRIFVYEHNTTPEREGFSKHAIWQRLFFHRINRFAQYPSQAYVLSKLKQRCFYLGSPLRKPEKRIVRTEPTLFLAPSFRLQVNELLKVKAAVQNREIIVKRGSLTAAELELLMNSLNVTPLDWIDLNTYLSKTIAVIVTIASRTRGSGWFNEAIKFGVPIIITSKDVQELFEETFPNYPFIRLDETGTPARLESDLKAVEGFAHEAYIDEYNKEMRERFAKIVGHY